MKHRARATLDVFAEGRFFGPRNTLPSSPLNPMQSQMS